MYEIPTERFARCIAVSKRVRWEIDDVIRGRQFDRGKKFLPDALTLAGRLDFLVPGELRYFSQVQGRTYANMFGLVERYIGAKVVDLSRDHCLGDQTALEAMLRFGDEELKHQELFRRVEAMIAEVMPAGYTFSWNPNSIAGAVLSNSNWAVLGLTLQIELFTQIHYVASIHDAVDLSELSKDIFKFHWKEECQHAILDELEWRRVDAATSADEREAAMGELVELIGTFDSVVQTQAAADSEYFIATGGRRFSPIERAAVQAAMLDAYRFQYIVSGTSHPHFVATLASLATEAQLARFQRAVTFPETVPTLQAA